MRTVSVTGDALTVADVVDVARGTATADLAASAAGAGSIQPGASSPR